MMVCVGSISASLEDYLETIYDLIKENGIARVSDIASKKTVRKSSVSGAIKKLESYGLVSHENYSNINLTKDGAKLASTLEKRHSVIKRFFTEIIMVPADIADKDACLIEHHIHSETVNGLDNFFKFLDSSADEDTKCLDLFRKFQKTINNKCTPSFESSLRLRDGKIGTKYRIKKIGGDGAVKMRLMEMGFLKGDIVEINRVAPLGDPIDVKIKGYNISLRKSEAGKIHIEELSE